MPNSVSSVRQVGWEGKDLQSSIARASTLGELLEMVPAIFRPRMQILVNKVYRAAMKSNHTRSYLMTLERHSIDNTFPPEIEGRIHSPAVQISKEYDASSEWRSFKQGMDTAILETKRALLNTVITVKKSEMAFLQNLFSEGAYSEETRAIYKEVVIDLSSDAGQTLDADGSVSIQSLPEWIRLDAQAFSQTRNLFPKRAVALAFITVQTENVRKMKALNLKRKADDDVEMQDISTQNQTVDALVSKKVEALLKEYKISQPSKLLSFSVFQKDKKLTFSSRQEDEKDPSEIAPSKQGEKGFATNRRRGKSQKQKRQREINQEVSKLDRAFRGAVEAHLRVSTSGKVVSGSQTVLGSPISDLRRKDRAVVSTAEAIKFLEMNPELFIGCSPESHRLFVSKHTPVSLFELQHQFDTGIFKGPGVVVPKALEHKLALNLKFILHQPPKLLRVHQAWPLLERSVRIRWHFRDNQRIPSKFYVPKKDWMPPQDKWNPVIEEGLQMGKELLFSQTALLNLGDSHKSNPDLRSLQSFLQSSSLLVKITDKNLGVAVLEKEWYQSQCTALLADMSTYDLIDKEDLDWYRSEGLKRLRQIVRRGNFDNNTSEFLQLSLNEDSIPEFHAIPKVHKAPWKLRPIIPSHSWFSRRASEVCDYALREVVSRRFPWVVDSTKSVISKLQDKTISRQDRIWLVTGDVEAFYTNVDVNETISKIRNHPHGFVQMKGFQRNDIADLLQIIMSCNCFSFNEKCYRQVAGIAMGTSCAPAFANLNLAFQEDTVEEITSSIMNNRGGLIHYCRYIDDILLVFKGTITDLQSLLEKLNSKFEPFKIGWKIHSTSEPAVFLDTELFFEQGFNPVGLQTRVYRKKLNKHQYIPWSSAHPITVKKGFVKAELTRFMIISSQKKFFEERTTEFMAALARRGYPGDILSQWRNQVKYDDRQFVLLKKKTIGYRGLPLMLPSTYDEIWEYLDVHSVFKAMLTKWAEVDEPLPESLRGPLIKSLRRSENLFDKFSSWNKAVLRALPKVEPLSLADRTRVGEQNDEGAHTSD